jgi:NAD+ kinase
MKKIGLVVKNDKDALSKADELESWLAGRNIEVFRRNVTFSEPRVSHKICDKSHSAIENSVSHGDEPPNDLSCVIGLGGDGTLLSVARWIGGKDIPIMGIKYGRMGFLAECLEENLFGALDRLIEGRFSINERMRLHVRVVREGRERVSEHVLNDVVISKSAISRVIYIKTNVDGQPLTTYTSDGLILATPTGSTAYSLAAGGPVIHPDVPGFILTPICPFTLSNRPMILPDSAGITIQIADKSSDAMLTIDGQNGVEIDYKDIIHVTKSKHPVQIIDLTNLNYFERLKTKLMWNGGSNN